MISVCMATYNGEKYIGEQLTSILNQIGSDDEVIISDDGSKDNTREIVESFNDKRIKFIVNKGIHGFTHNFENALLKAKGDYIFLSDQDDIWMNDKVSIVMKAFKYADLLGITSEPFREYMVTINKVREDKIIYLPQHSEKLIFENEEKMGFAANTVPAKFQSYLSAGKPILASIDGGAREIINDCKCGMAVGANDIVGFANIIKSFIENLNIYISCGENGIRYFNENYLKEIVINKLEIILNKMINCN